MKIRKCFCPYRKIPSTYQIDKIQGNIASWSQEFLGTENGICALFLKYIQSNLSIADMLYNGHLVTADTFLRNRPIHGQTLIEKHTWRTLLCTTWPIFVKIYFLIADTLWLVGRKENMHVFIWRIFLHWLSFQLLLRECDDL